VHDYHEGQPGYSEHQVLHDGCGECADRAKSRDGGLGDMDNGSFVRAWHRAAEWNRAGLPDLAQAEVPALSMLWSVQLKLENFGIPIGTVPHA